jgi:hypothetical protein
MINADFAATLLSMLLVWITCAWICLGFGWAIVRWLLHTEPRPADFLWAFWIGFGIVIEILQLWHLVLPINGYTYFAVAGGGLLLALPAITPLANCARRIPRRQIITFLLLTIVLTLWIADRSAGPGSFYDSGLYHLPAMLWASTYRIVPGLANLHMRFGFSSWTALLAAFLNQGLWPGNANHLMNGFFTAALGVMVVRGLLRIAAGTARLEHWLALFSGLAIAEWAVDIQISSVSSDIAVVMLTLVSAIAFVSPRVDDENDSDRLLPLMACLTLCALCVSAKLSTLPFAGPLAVGAAYLLIHKKNTLRANGKTLAIAGGIGAALFITWIISQVILSGYPLFPSTAFALPVDWKYPREDALILQKWIVNYARWAKFEDPQKYSDWLGYWMVNRALPPWNIWKGFFPFVGGTILFLGTLTMWPRFRRLIPNIPRHLYLVACTFLGIAFWFASSPDPRLGSQLPLALWATGAALFATTCVGNSLRSSRWLFVALALIIDLGPSLQRAVYIQGGVTKLTDVLWLPPGPDRGLYPTPVETHLRTWRIGPGVVGYAAPLGSDQVWLAPLPNAPIMETRVVLRHPGKIQGGFRRIK